MLEQDELDRRARENLALTVQAAGYPNAADLIRGGDKAPQADPCERCGQPFGVGGRGATMGDIPITVNGKPLAV